MERERKWRVHQNISEENGEDKIRSDEEGWIKFTFETEDAMEMAIYGENEKKRVRILSKQKRIAAGKVEIGTEDVKKLLWTNVYATLVVVMNHNQKSVKRTFLKQLGYLYGDWYGWKVQKDACETDSDLGYSGRKMKVFEVVWRFCER